MEYFGIDEKVLYPSSSFLNDSVSYEQKPKRSLGKLRDNINIKGKKRKKR